MRHASELARAAGLVLATALLSCSALLSLCAKTASAQPTDHDAAAAPEPAEYRSLIEQAVREFDAHDYSEARALFQQAHTSYPNARTLRGLGLAEYELRHYLRARSLLEQALHDARKPLAGDLRMATEAAAKRVEAFVGTYRIAFEPAGADAFIDDAPAIVEADGMLELEAGEHTLVVSAPGFATREMKIDVVGGGEQTLSVRLESIAAPYAETSAPTPARQPAPVTVQRGAGVWPWIVIAGSGALMAGGGVFLLLAQHDMSTVQHAKKGSAWADVEDEYQAVPGWRVAGVSLLAAGAAGVATGLIWRALSDREVEQESAVQATATPNGVLLTGRF